MSDHDSPPPDLPDAPGEDEQPRPGTGAPQGNTEPARDDESGRTPTGSADNLPSDEYRDAGASDAPEVGTETPDSAADSTEG